MLDIRLKELLRWKLLARFRALRLVLLLSALSFLLSLPQKSFAQNGNIQGQVIQPSPPVGTGGPASNATVLVCPATAIGNPCSPAGVSLYLDPALTIPTSDPFTSDQYGNYSLWTTPGPYLVQVTPVAGITYSEIVNAVGGTVSLVGLTLPGSVFAVSNSPITGSGTIGVTFVSQAPGSVFANCTGATYTPSFCALTAAMIPTTLNGTTFDGNTSVVGTFGVTGNTTLTGTLGVTGATSVTNTGVFTNTQQNDYVTSVVNGISIPAQFQLAQGSNYATEAGAFGVSVPTGATVHQIDAVAGYLTDACNSSTASICNGVAGYFQAIATANNAAVWGINPLCQDTVGVSNAYLLCDEVDVNVYGSPTYVTAIVGNGYGQGTIPAGVQPGTILSSGSAFMDIFSAYSTNYTSGSFWQWGTGINFRPGAISSSGAAIQIQYPCQSGACASNAITYTSVDSSRNSHIVSDSSGYGVPTINCTVGSTYRNSGATSASTVLYVCYPTNVWTAVTVP